MAALATQATTLFALKTVRDWLKISDNSLDTRIVRIADAVSQRIETRTGRAFVTRAFTETHNGIGERRLKLRNRPVTTITSLTVKDAPDQTPIALVESTDYDADYRLGIIKTRYLTIPKGFQNVVAVYSAGYGAQDAATLPQDIYEAGLEYVKLTWTEDDANAIAATSVGLGPNTFLLKPGIPWQIKNVIDFWSARQL